jgi:hypothetical protein
MENLDEQLNAIMDEKSDAENEILLDNQFPYLFYKAFLYLKIGPEKYRKDDFFKQPLEGSTQEELDFLTTGCNQIIQGFGFFKNEPFTGLSVSAFYSLMRLFHFQYLNKTTKYNFNLNDQKGILDCIMFKHAIDGRTCTLYNFC